MNQLYKILIHIISGSSPLLLIFVFKKLNIPQPFNDYTYLAFSIFGLSCISYTINWGVKIDSEEYSVKKRINYRLVSQIPQLVLLLFLIGRIEPSIYPFDRGLMILCYLFSVSSVIWSERIAILSYNFEIPVEKKPIIFPQEKIKLILKSLSYVSISFVVTLVLSIIFNFGFGIGTYATVFLGLISCIMWFGDKIEIISKKKIKN